MSALAADPLVYPVAGTSLSRRIEAALAGLAAFDAIEQPRPLTAGTRAGETQGADAALALDAASRDRLRAARAALEDAALALVASRRPDWGAALLLAAARLVAIDESLAACRLVTLDALPADRAAVLAFVARESERRLGGHVDPAAGANFIPFVASRNVRARWEVEQRIHLPSAREHAVAREGTLRSALRESNVVTSTLYAPADDDGFFVFFSDGRWPLRPLLGAVNLGAALARTGIGILQLPFDRGRGLRDGLDGALWSVPELFFASIRKGTSEYVMPELRPPPG